MDNYIIEVTCTEDYNNISKEISFFRTDKEAYSFFYNRFCGIYDYPEIIDKYEHQIIDYLKKNKLNITYAHHKRQVFDFIMYHVNDVIESTYIINSTPYKNISLEKLLKNILSKKDFDNTVNLYGSYSECESD